MRSYNSYAGQQINVETYNAYTAREHVQANKLAAKDFERLRAVCVRTRAIDDATSLLRAHNAVALIGSPGCGRRTAGWAAITDLGAMPHYPIYLDPDDDRRDLPADPGCGYLLDIDEQAISEVNGLKDLIGAYREQLAEVGSYLVVMATWAAWNRLGQPTGVSQVVVTQPSAIEVFR